MSDERLTVCTWKWKERDGYHSHFTAAHVNTLRAMVDRCYRKPHDFVCITDDPAGIDGDIRTVPIWNDYSDLPGPNGVNCYRRMRAFSVEAAEIIGPRFVSLDLDGVLRGDVTPLWDRPEDFVIWGDTARNTPYNGSMWLLRAGTRRQVWETFDREASPRRARMAGMVGSDQAWIGVCLGPNEPRWTEADGVHSWRVHIKKRGGALPDHARAVFFHGREKPWQPELQARFAWIREHYR